MKIPMLRLSWLLFAVFLASPSPTSAASAPRRVRLLAPSAHLKVLSEALDRFARDVREGTKGELIVERTNPQPRDMASQLVEGEAEMGQVFSSELARFVPAIQALELPYAFRDYEQALQFLDGPQGQGLLAALAPHNLRGIAFTFSGGFKIIPTQGRELRRLEDFNGLRLRVYPGEVSLAMAQAWGVKPNSKPLPPGLQESLDGMKSGELDGAEMTYPVLGMICRDPAVKVINETYHSLRATALVINERFYQTLTVKQREVLSKAALEAAKAERLASIAEAESMRRFCLSHGVTIVEMSPSESERLAQAARPVYERFKPILGKELVTSILDRRSRPASAGPSR